MENAGTLSFEKKLDVIVGKISEWKSAVDKYAKFLHMKANLSSNNEVILKNGQGICMRIYEGDYPVHFWAVVLPMIEAKLQSKVFDLEVELRTALKDSIA